MKHLASCHLAFDHVDEAAVCQDSIGSKHVEEVREVLEDRRTAGLQTDRASLGRP